MKDGGKEEAGTSEKFKHLPHGFGIEWTSRRAFQIDGYRFNLPTSWGHFDINVPAEENYADNAFFFGKSVSVIQKYFALFREQLPTNIVELGIFRGGSVAFLQLVAKPERLLALDINPDRQEFLDRFILHKGLAENVRAEYGVDQADSEKVSRLTREFIGEGRCLDFVVDDASHLLSPTRSSFETLFPLLRPGGSYVIEDFSAAQIIVSGALDATQGLTESRRQLASKILEFTLQADNKPLHLIAVEAMLASFVAPGIVHKVIVDRDWLRIVRGREDIDPARKFDLRAVAVDHFGLLESTPNNELQRYLSVR